MIISKKLRIMCAAAALALLAFPVSCGANDDTDNEAGNGVNSNGIYDGSPENGGQTILDDAADSIQNGASNVMSDIAGIDDGMTNNSTTTTTSANKARSAVTSARR